MKLQGLHLLLTYKCTYECDHCFVWGSPRQEGTLTREGILDILDEGESLGMVEWIYFEGGEPFLYYPALVFGVQEAAGRGFRVGIVTNGYWAVSAGDALAWLSPFRGKVQDLALSCDDYHGRGRTEQALTAHAAAEQLGIPVGIIAVAGPEAGNDPPPGATAVRYRGRAAMTLTERAGKLPWAGFDACPHENLRDPDRVHVDPFGNVHLCQGIVIGNLFRTPLAEICGAFDPDRHPIVGPLLSGGPAALVRSHGIQPGPAYADACHLCYEARRRLRPLHPDSLAPGPVYGVMPEGWP
jgi:MoaA/NifB/PqqE/SkfB family radical SAM enzyme